MVSFRNIQVVTVLAQILGIVSATCAAASAYFAYGAFKEAHRQANAADAQNRPWLKVVSLSPIDVDRSSPIYFGSSFQVQVENIGHSPAVQIFVASRIQISYFERKSDIKFQEKFCKEAEFEQIVTGPVSFPNDKTNAVTTNIRRTEDIALAAQNNGLDPKDPLKFEVVGCVLYRTSTLDGPVYKTSFLATVYADKEKLKPGVDMWKSASVGKMYPMLETYNGSYAD